MWSGFTSKTKGKGTVRKAQRKAKDAAGGSASGGQSIALSKWWYLVSRRLITRYICSPSHGVTQCVRRLGKVEDHVARSRCQAACPPESASSAASHRTDVTLSHVTLSHKTKHNHIRPTQPNHMTERNQPMENWLNHAMLGQVMKQSTCELIALSVCGLLFGFHNIESTVYRDGKLGRWASAPDGGFRWQSVLSACTHPQKIKTKRLAWTVRNKTVTSFETTSLKPCLFVSCIVKKPECAAGRPRRPQAPGPGQPLVSGRIIIQ